MRGAIQLDLEEQIVRIRRAIVESDKFAAEQRKLTAEAAKLDRDRTVAPYLALAALLGSIIGGIATFLAHLLLTEHECSDPAVPAAGLK